LKLDEEVAALRKQRKKRQMSFERRQKRDHRVKARNLVDRREIEADLKPRA
jgi:ribosome biogenesis GTPase